MKKLVSVLFALLLVGSFAFADVAVGAWGRFIFSPISSIDDSDNYAYTGPSWAGGSRVGFNVAGTSDNAGFKLNVDSNGNTLGVGDNAKIWIKINEMVTVQGGKVQGDVLRGKIDDSGTLNAIPGLTVDLGVDADGDGVLDTMSINMAQATTGKDDVFARFYPKLGFLLDLTPAEGVYLGVALDTNGTAGVLTEDMMKKVQIGAGYVLADVGHIRAQYIGNVDEVVVNGTLVDAPKYFQAAFAYTAMEGLVVDAGLKYQFVDKAGKSTATVHATYAMDALSTLGRLQVGFGEDNGNDELLIKASADVAYTVADPFAIGAEVSYYKEGDPMGLSILPYGKLGYGNGYVRAGFLYSMFNGVFFGEEYDYTAWSLPITFEYWF